MPIKVNYCPMCNAKNELVVMTPSKGGEWILEEERKSGKPTSLPVTCSCGHKYDVEVKLTCA